MNTKKKFLTRALTALSVFSGIIICIYFIITSFYMNVDLKNINTVELNYEYGDVSIHTQLDDNDAKRVAEICKGQAAKGFSIPSCGFGTAELVFKGRECTIKLYPACDSCDTMRVGKNNSFNYSIGERNRTELEKILEKYGATFPCV